MSLEKVGRALDGDDWARALARLLWRVHAAVQLLASGRAGGGSIPSLRIPLVAGVPVAAQAIGWLGCLETTGLLRGRPSPVSIAFPEEEESLAGNPQRSLWIVLRPPNAHDLLMLAAAPDGLLWPDHDLRQPEEALVGRRSYVAACERFLRERERSLAQLATWSLDWLT